MTPGDLLVSAVSGDLGNFEMSWSAANWIKLLERVVAYDPAPSLCGASFALFYRVATGSDTLTIDNSNSPVKSQFITYRIAGGGVPVGTTREVKSGLLDPPALTPGSGARNFLWLTFGATGFPEQSDRSLIGAPSGFGELVVASQLDGFGQSLRYSLAGAERSFAASSLDPAAYGYSSSSQAVRCDAVAATVAIPSIAASGFFF
ncbi:hypothetical protein ACFFTK_08880 [Pseudonocardia petroleophila]|uniref:Uncharacterized protein n=1 Tax=Pseudonocardia petroleophila TaxID=37331 RepID=A0A7G7MFW4_9PSEU|nr:hypothetical protein [Pseudonocardia petroleophila]QNG51675.1 hypothetical protein H6H00_26805 [Pseudonocardia petroleophila]